MAVVQEAIENGGGDYGITKHGAPLADTAITGDQNGTPLVAAADELEEEVRGIGLQRQLAALVNDQELGFDVGD